MITGSIFSEISPGSAYPRMTLRVSKFRREQEAAASRPARSKSNTLFCSTFIFIGPRLSARSGRKVNFGPMFSALTYVKQNPDPSGFDTYYNLCCPRCGISQWTSSRWAKDSDISWMINTNTEIYSFWSLLRGDFSGSYVGCILQVTSRSAEIRVAVFSPLLVNQPSSYIMRRLTGLSGCGRIKTRRVECMRLQGRSQS